MTDGRGDPAARSQAVSPLVAADAAGLRVRIVRPAADAADPAAAPFVVLHEGRFSRVLLAEIVGGSGHVLGRFAWKLRCDDGRARVQVAGKAPGNGEVDAMWARERAELARVRSPHVVAGVPALAAIGSSAPVMWCRRVDRFFHPPSPATGKRLRVCRDDSVLAACGLPAYEAGVERYLHDGGDELPPTLYRRAGADVETTASGATLRSNRQLVRDFAGLVHAPAGDAVAAAAALDLPCVTCPHRAVCWPKDAGAGGLPGERELHVVSFHDVEGIALEACDFDWAEATALLGGAAVQDVLRARGAGRAGALDAAVAQQLEQGAQWLFADDPSRRLLEVLRQKLCLFLDVIAGVAAVHGTGRPHLALAPQHVLASLRTAHGVPVRWQLHAVVADLGSASPVSMPAAGASPRLAVGPMLEPGHDMRDAAGRAWLPETLLGRDDTEIVLQVACWQKGNPDGLVRFVVEVQGPGVPRTCRAGDIAMVQPTNGGPVLVACLDEVRPRALTASALLPATDPCLAWDGRQFEARLSFHRRLGPAADFHGLGMLLLHALLVDDSQGIDDVADAMGKTLRRLEDEPTGVRVEERPASARLQQLLQAKDLRARFEPAHLLHRTADREALSLALARGQAPIPPALWGRLLAVAAKAIATWPPFAWVGTLADGSTAPLQQLTAEVAAVIARLDVELFFGQRRDQAVATACAEAAEMLRARMGAGKDAGGALAGGAPGFRLLVRRDGDSQVQELRYEIDRVTIGRREGENLLRLSDPMVSSAHAVIEATPEGWVVADRNSTNGTEVDGIRLPVDVPQPLEDGSVIVIRPFQLTFHTLTPTAELTAMTPVLTTAALQERLHDAFAKEHDRGSLHVHEALLAVLRAAAAESPPAEVLARLPELAGATSPDPAAAGGGGLDSVSARALQQLSRSLLGPADFQTPEQVQQFVGKLGRFVDTTAHWIERMLELRKLLGKHLDLGIASTASGRPSARTASDVRQLVAGWSDDAPAADPAAWYVAKFYDDVVAILVGLLAGNQQIRKAVKERLEPQRLVEAAGREATLRLLVQAAAGSALWKHYVQAFQEVTGGAELDAELANLLQRVSALRS